MKSFDQYEFYDNEKNWIEDFLLFVTIKDKFGNVVWSDWPKEYRHRYLSTLHEFRLANRIRFDYHLFVQYIFNQQWNQFKTYVNQFEIKLIGDLPMYVDCDSADVWANSHLFLLDSTRVILLVDSTVNSQFKSSSFPEN